MERNQWAKNISNSRCVLPISVQCIARECSKTHVPWILTPCIKFVKVFWAIIISTPFDFRALSLPLRWQCKSKIYLQSKFQPNRTSGYGVTAILFKIWPKFDPSSGTLWPIPKIFTMYNLLYCGGSVSKFQPPRTKTVAGASTERTFLACAFYMFRICRWSMKWKTAWSCRRKGAI